MNYFEIFMLIICTINVQCQQNPHPFTQEEKMFLFQSELVPEYEIIPVKHNIKKRSLGQDYEYVFLRAFNRNLSLYLEPKDSVLIGKDTKIWSAEPNFRFPQGVKYKVISNFKNTNFQTMHDVKNMAAITMEKDDNGNMKLFGHIGDDLVIQPLPDRMLNYYNRQKRQIRATSYYSQLPFMNDNWKKRYFEAMIDDWNSNTTPHIIHKLPPVKQSKAKQPRNWRRFDPENNGNEFTSSKVDTVYPEILLFVDNLLFKKLGRDTEVIKKYIASYWNAVDLRFRQLTNPMVRINIAGIILSTGTQEVPFIKNSSYKGSKVDADKVLIEIGQHLLSNKIFTFRRDYDLFMTMTSYDMCNWETYGEDCTTMGYAYVAAACSILDKPRMVEAVGMVEDNGGFKGIMPSAHELGHILGVSHDEATYGNDCEFEDGYIMENKLAFSENSFDWSPCSLRNFSIFLNNPNTACLRNEPNIGGKLKNLLPGLHYSLEYQCQQFRHGSKPCKKSQEIKNVCMGLECTEPASNDCVRVVPAAEGSPCGHKSICLNGKCISSMYYYYETSNG